MGERIIDELETVKKPTRHSFNAQMLKPTYTPPQMDLSSHPKMSFSRNWFTDDRDRKFKQISEEEKRRSKLPERPSQDDHFSSLAAQTSKESQKMKILDQPPSYRPKPSGNSKIGKTIS